MILVSASVVPPMPALEQRHFVETKHAAHVKRQIKQVPVMEATREHVPDQQIDVKVMEHVNLVR